MKKIILTLILLQISQFSFAEGSTSKQVNEGLVGKSVGVTPIGGVVAWFPPPNESKPPDGWVLCDGEIISEPKSPFDKSKSPNLNKTKLFLRGSNDIAKVKKKEIEEQDWKSFQVSSRAGTTNTSEPIMIPKKGPSSNIYSGWWVASNSQKIKGGTDLVFNWDGTEIHPKNMSVIWIMRVY